MDQKLLGQKNRVGQATTTLYKNLDFLTWVVWDKAWLLKWLGTILGAQYLELAKVKTPKTSSKEFNIIARCF